MGFGCQGKCRVRGHVQSPFQSIGSKDDEPLYGGDELTALDERDHDAARIGKVEQL
jgi:hypothetical protein